MRVCLYGGPGAGKSTMAHYLMWYIKNKGLSCEFVPELIKLRAYGGEPPTGVQQVAVTGRQLDAEVRALGTGAHVVTESPILLGSVYGDQHTSHHLPEVERELQEEYDTVSIFLDRGNKEYNTEGRWGGREGAIELDRRIQNHLSNSGFEYRSFAHSDFVGVASYIEERMDESYKTLH